ncbi:MAG TPA: hypothetical protein VK158_00940 [Acidobacteriota bacterium]|nr:hypothetical protein [Acidobacteriota bacterium]
MQPYHLRVAHALHDIHVNLKKIQLPYTDISRISIVQHTSQGDRYTQNEFKSGNTDLCIINLTSRRKSARNSNSLAITSIDDYLSEEVQEIVENTLRTYQIPYRQFCKHIITKVAGA